MCAELMGQSSSAEHNSGTAVPVEMRLTYEQWGRTCPVPRPCRHRVREMRPPCPEAPKGGPGGRKSDFRPFFRPLERSSNAFGTPAQRQISCRCARQVRRPGRSSYSQSESGAGHGRERWRVPAVSARRLCCPRAHRPGAACQHRACNRATDVPPPFPRPQCEIEAFPSRS